MGRVIFGWEPGRTTPYRAGRRYGTPPRGYSAAATIPSVAISAATTVFAMRFAK